MRQILTLIILTICLCLPTQSMASPCSDAADNMLNAMNDNLGNHENEVVVVTMVENMVTTGLFIIAPDKSGKPTLFNINELGKDMNEKQLNKLDQLLSTLEKDAGVHIDSQTEVKDKVTQNDTVTGVATANSKSKAAQNLAGFLNSL